MHLVVIDLIPALLSWEGRDRSGEPSVAPGAADALEHLASHWAVTGVADAHRGSARLRAHLEREALDGYFESVGSSAEFGPLVSARVVRRLAAALKIRTRELVVVTARGAVAEDLRINRIRCVLTSHAEFGTVDNAVEAMLSGRVTP
ncbi:MAG TPA: hypothetical protein VMM81_07825 [Acidimicrobiia bacterium]|nr:hypothetical protein [Acidimicrobiia bacterium]